MVRTMVVITSCWAIRSVVPPSIKGLDGPLQWRCESPVQPAAMSVLVVGLGLSAAVGLLAWAPSVRRGRRCPLGSWGRVGPVAGAARAPGLRSSWPVVALTAPLRWRAWLGDDGRGPCGRYLADRLAGSGFEPGVTPARSFSGSVWTAPRGRRPGRRSGASGRLRAPQLGRDWVPHGGSRGVTPRASWYSSGTELAARTGVRATTPCERQDRACARRRGPGAGQRRRGSRSPSRRGDAAPAL